MNIFGFSGDYAMARATGLDRGTIRNILNRDRIGPKSARLIATALDLSMAWVESGFGPMRPGEDSVVTPDPFAVHKPGAEGFAANRKNQLNSPRERLNAIIETFEFGSLSTLASAGGLPLADIQGIFQSDQITDAQARSLADNLGIEYDWIRSGVGPFQKPGAEIHGYKGFPSDEAAEMAGAAAGEPQPEVRENSSQLVLVPKAKTTLGAGGGIIPEEGLMDEPYAFRLHYLKSLGCSTGRVILFDVNGDSMAPRFLDGDTVLVDMNRKRLQDGGVYAIAVGDVVQIKLLQGLTGGRIRVISVNPEYHTYEVLPDELRIIGQVVWFGRTVIRLKPPISGRK